MPNLSRREFVAAAAVAHPALRALAPGGDFLAAGPTGIAKSADWPRYAAATVIDCLASPGPFNTPARTGAPLTDEMVANAKASGITAVNVTVSGGGPGHASFDSTVTELAYWERELVAHPDVFHKVRTVADLAQAKRSGRLGLIFGFQDAVMLEGDVRRLDLFHRFGVKVVQLTYNVRNLLGDGCLEPDDAGLSKHGRDVVARMNELGMLVDLAHCGTATTDTAIAASTRPVAITHSGCKAVFDHPRSKTDATLRRLADQGGVIGIYLMPFINPAGQPTSADLIRQLEHAIEVAGEDHVGIGSDLSITPHRVTPEYERMHRAFVAQRKAAGIAAPREEDYMFVTDLNSPRRLEQIAERLASRGHKDARIEKVIGGNFARLFGEVWDSGAPA
ncbi:MAG: dipeptidase [Gemmatimonadales bacterium]